MNETKIIELIKEIFGKEKVKRFVPGAFSASGIPDLYLNGENIECFCEVKYRSTKLSHLQKAFFRNATKTGIIIRVNPDTLSILIYAPGGDYYPAELNMLPDRLYQKTKQIYNIQKKDISQVISC